MLTIDRETAGGRLRLERVRINRTIKSLAEDLLMSRSSLCLKELGRRPVTDRDYRVMRSSGTGIDIEYVKDGSRASRA